MSKMQLNSSESKNLSSAFKSVYGPVVSWRFGRSLGIDPIGLISTCSFNCVYCQLGEIQRHTTQRQVFVSTQAEYIRLMQQLQPDEIQLNTVTRPRPLNRHLESRGAHDQSRSHPTQVLKQVSRDFLETFANQIQEATKISVRYVP